MRRTKAVDKFLTKFDRELKSGMISLILLYMIDHAKESMYGYQIIREIKERTGGSLDFKEGTIYPILRNLEAQGLLQSAWDTRGERPRKYYHITKDGTSALQEAINDWTTFSGIIGKLLMVEPTGGVCEESLPEGAGEEEVQRGERKEGEHSRESKEGTQMGERKDRARRVDREDRVNRRGSEAGSSSGSGDGELPEGVGTQKSSGKRDEIRMEQENDEEELVEIDQVLEDIRKIVKGRRRRPPRGDGNSG